MRYFIGLLALAVAPAFAAESFTKLAASFPWFFIEDSASRFVVETPRMRAMFTPEGAAFQAGQGQIRVGFADADSSVKVQGMQPEGRANFLIGQDAGAWRTGLKTYSQILYSHLYPGIDLTYSGRDGHLKSEFRVAPGADPRRIRLEYSEDLAI